MDEQEVQKEKLKAIIGGLYMKARQLILAGKSHEAQQRTQKALALMEEYRRRFGEIDD